MHIRRWSTLAVDDENRGGSKEGRANEERKAGVLLKTEHTSRGTGETGRDKLDVLKR
jgi:hypothetical protein